MIAPPNQSDIDFPEDELVMKDVAKPTDPDQLWKNLTIALFGGTVLVLIFVFWIYLNPQAPINPYPPVVIPPTIVLPTSTITPTITET